MGKEIELFLSFAELFEYLEIVTIYLFISKKSLWISKIEKHIVLIDRIMH